MPYLFGPFELQPEERRLLSGGTAVSISPRAFDLLVTLVENGGRLLTKDELLDRVWPRVVVEENALQAQISALRKILGSEAIATVARSGYRFTLEIARGEPAVSPPSVKNNLPQPSTSFIGREQEIVQIRLLLGRSRLLTLTGAGGCGKTRLSIQVAQGLLRAYPDGIWFIEFAPLADGGLVPRALAAVLGIPERPGHDLTRVLAEQLSRRRMLLVLDNAEHLADAVSSLIDDLLLNCENVAFLVTSRQPLRVAGESTHRVPSLSVPDPGHDTALERLGTFESVQLFVDRVRLQRPHFALTAGVAPAVASICHRLDGIPLAIELAAPRLRMMSAEEVNRRLDDRFGLLTNGPRTSLHRQRTLRAMIDWSHDLLTQSEQALLSRTSVFAGGWTLDAAEQACFMEGEVPAKTLGLLNSLADKSLIQAEEQDGSTRYRMLESVRQYGVERLSEGGTLVAWQKRHAQYHLALAEDISPRLLEGNPLPLLDQLNVEHDNMRAALAWYCNAGADAMQALKLAAAMSRFWLRRGHYDEALKVLERVLESTPDAQEAAERAVALHAAGHLLDLRGGADRARSLYEESLAINKRVGTPRSIASSLNGVGVNAWRRGDYVAARAYHEEGLEYATRQGDRTLVAVSLSNLGLTLSSMGEYGAAKGLHIQSLALRRELGDRWGVANSLHNLSTVTEFLGEYEESRVSCEECLSIWQALGDRRGVAYGGMRRGLLANACGDFAAALTSFRECLPALVDLGDRGGIATVVAGVAAAMGRTSVLSAARLWGAAEQLGETGGTSRGVGERRREELQIAAARASFGDDETFERAWQVGRAMELGQVVRLAMEVEADNDV